IREGTAAKNLADLFPILNTRNSRRCMFVSDDKHPDELISSGHLNAALRKAVSMGLDPFTAIQMASLNPSQYFKLDDRGALAPGKIADITVIDSLIDFNVSTVIKNGKVIVQNKQIKTALPYYKDKLVLSSVKVKPFTINALKIKPKDGLLNVIRIIPDQIITEKYRTNPTLSKTIKKTSKKISVSSVSLWQKGEVISDIERDILKLVVIERHKKTGNIGIGFVTGLGLKKGALASSVAHDSHNIIATGTNDKDIFFAIKQVIKMQGGFVAVDKEKTKACLPLPIAGLMSDQSAEAVSNKLKELLAVVKSWQTKISNPFITLSFLALPVIPELKLTDKGLFDVSRFKIVELFEK
ncbi:MAG: adenine deaminase, partial [Candidatus Latescibacteria bacterium]|nr:adenine deaminase [Candidatus Latescibacterota bacterium]